MNKTALVTGAAHGIGRSIAAALAADSYHLHLIARTSGDELDALAASLSEQYGVLCTSTLLDVSDATAVDAYFKEHIRHLDLLVNNAGISHIGLLQDMSDTEWDDVIRTDLSASFYFAKRAIPLFLASGSGRIINISSVWGNVGAAGEVAYSAAKGGLNTFTRALAKELAPSGIAVNAVSCGVIDTRMNACFTPDEMQNLINEIPADRLGTPDEVAQTVLLLSKMPAYVTGQILTIDGGFT